MEAQRLSISKSHQSRHSILTNMGDAQSNRDKVGVELTGLQAFSLCHLVDLRLNFQWFLASTTQGPGDGPLNDSPSLSVTSLFCFSQSCWYFSQGSFHIHLFGKITAEIWAYLRGFALSFE